MFKTAAKLFISFLLSTLLITFNAAAFHYSPIGHNHHLLEIDHEDGMKKSNLQFKYCTENVIKQQKIIITEDNSEVEEEKESDTPKKKKDEVKKAEVYKLVWLIKDHHTSEKIELPVGLDFSILKKMELIDEISTISEVLSYFCVQEFTYEQRKFKIGAKSDISKLYNTIATVNGYESKDDPIYGSIFDQGFIFWGAGEPLIVSDAVFIHDEKNKIQKAKDDQEKQIKEQRIAKANARKKGNDAWISGNKQDWIDKFNIKLADYDTIIQNLNTTRLLLEDNLKTLETLFENTKESVSETFEDVDTSKSEIKKLKKKIRVNVKKFLVESELKDFQARLKKLKKIKFEKKFTNYKKLDKLIKKAKKSKSAAEFVGTDPVDIKVLGFTFVFKQKTIGYIQEYNDLKNKLIGQLEYKQIKDLDKKINNKTKKIEEFIVQPIAELNAIDEELSSKIPILQYLIYFLIFLVVVAVIVYIYFQNKKISFLSEETQHVVKKSSELEGQLRDTSKQIKSVTQGVRTQQSTETAPVQEVPKTPEQIIESKYDELVFDYKETLEDYSKVAEFKQKWHGLALSKKARQDGTKTILINSTRAFEKAEIWCVTFSEKYFAFPGSTVKAHMPIYMNFDYQKADAELKGVFAISEGSSYSTVPSVLRRGGAGFIVERVGKLVFPK